MGRGPDERHDRRRGALRHPAARGRAGAPHRRGGCAQASHEKQRRRRGANRPAPHRRRDARRAVRGTETNRRGGAGGGAARGEHGRGGAVRHAGRRLRRRRGEGSCGDGARTHRRCNRGFILLASAAVGVRGLRGRGSAQRDVMT